MEFAHDYYAILGISSDADERAIKRSYRQLALRYHPDTSTEVDAAERFREIQEAYELLIDPMQREAYDHWRRQQGLDHPLPLMLRVTPSHDVLPSLGEPQAMYVLVELTASEKVESQRLPLNLCLVLDRSTSMKGARLQQVKEAARYIVNRMKPDDVLSLVVFSDRAELVLPGQRGIDKQAARVAVSGIRAGGGTELLQGLRLGLQEVERWRSDAVLQPISHLILLTDGQTYGDEEECLQAAKLAGKRQIPLTTMGIGSDWNDKLLDQMARLSGAPGGSYYIDSSAKIAKAFHDRIHGLGSIFANNLQLIAHQHEEVSIKEVFRVSPQISQLFFVENQLALGSLEKQQPQAIIMELMVSGLAPGSHRLLQIAVEGEVPSLGRQPVRAQQQVTVTFDADLDRRAPIPPDIVSAMGKLTIYKMQERAMAEIESGNVDSAVRRLKTMATRLLDIGEPELARAALLEAGRLAQTGSLSEEGRKKIRYGTRGLTILPKEVLHD
jgi:Ca-activated chloride channel family protein